MKKLISILLVIAMMAAFAACGNKTNGSEELPQSSAVENTKDNIDITEDEIKDNKDTDPSGSEPHNEADNKKPNGNPAEAVPNDKKPSTKPADEQIHLPNQPVENKPAENKPIENKPAESKPATPSTLGGKLLAAFNANASSKSGEELANAILSIPEIEFSPVVMAVEEGMLTGFGNNEIKGFKSGTVFAPMIGSIPFVGYVFELENASDASSFILKLKSSANLRWNVCTEADEMITGSAGNKVFFVMCPTDFDEE